MATSLTTGRPWRVILAFSIPLLLGNVVQQLYQFADAIVVGRHLGVTSLAAVGATGSLLFLLLGFAWGLTSGFAIPIAQAFGARDDAAVRRSVATGVLLSAITSVILTVGAPLLAGPILALLQTPPELMPEATIFTQISFLGASATMFFNYLSAIIRAIGDSKTPLVFLTIACALNVALVVLMVGPLEWGVGGAALATVVAQAVSVALCLEFVRRRLPMLHLRRTDWRVSGADIAEHLRLGLPMGFQASIIAIGTLTVQVALNTLGADAVAAYTTGSRVDSLAVALLSSLGLAVSMYAAQNHGGRRPDRIRRGVVEATWMAVGAGLVLGGLLIAFGAPMVRLFIGDGSDDVVDLAHRMLIINGCGYWALGMLFVLRGALQARAHPRADGDRGDRTGHARGRGRGAGCADRIRRRRAQQSAGMGGGDHPARARVRARAPGARKAPDPTGGGDRDLGDRDRRTDRRLHGRRRRRHAADPGRARTTRAVAGPSLTPRDHGRSHPDIPLEDDACRT